MLTQKESDTERTQRQSKEKIFFNNWNLIEADFQREST
ncbi:MAG: hypothetical protein CM15mV141_210 [uncultured marine virus]|nr:MAG: hypothetical protein CM15mV141_210 [uncultured marine virus]